MRPRRTRGHSGCLQRDTVNSIDPRRGRQREQVAAGQRIRGFSLSLGMYWSALQSGDTFPKQMLKAMGCPPHCDQGGQLNCLGPFFFSSRPAYNGPPSLRTEEEVEKEVGGGRTRASRDRGFFLLGEPQMDPSVAPPPPFN